MTEATLRTPGVSVPALSLSGGPLIALGRKLGLVRRSGDSVALGVALGWTLWLILMALAAVQGEVAKLMSLSLLGGHVRLLLVIPLLFLCESALHAHARQFVALLANAGVVPRASLPVLQSNIENVRRWSDSWVADVGSIAAAALLTWSAGALHIAAKTASIDPTKSFASIPLAASFYWLVCLPAFRFVMFRLLWRLLLWWRFLWSLSRMPLHLVPTHPDGVAGLGYLEVVQTRMAPLALAISAVAAASFAEEISTGRSIFEVVYPEMALTVIFSVVLILGPPLIFVAKLRAAQERGLLDYGALASRYVSDFERKWITAPQQGEPLLGSGDFQSLADLNSVVEGVRNMRLAPVSTRLLIAIVAAAMAPMLPIFLFKYPLAELLKKVFMTLTGGSVSV